MRAPLLTPSHPPPTLDLRFTDGSNTLDPRITFTRADATSCATYFNAAGTLTTVAANVPRFDYDPVTLLPRGLLIEEARTNYLLQSSGLAGGAPWITVAAAVVAAAAVAPDGTLTATKLTEDNTAGTPHLVQQTAAGIAANVPTTASLYVRNGTRRYIMVMVFDATTPGNQGLAGFDLLAGTAATPATAGAAAAVSSTISAAGGGWFRVSVTVTLSAAATTGISVRLNLSNTLSSVGISVNYTGDNASYVYAWGAMIEAGAFPTSYVPTTAAAATRAADVATMPVGTWFNAAAGTVGYEGCQSAMPVGFPPVLVLDDSTVNNRMEIILNTSTTTLGQYFAVGTRAGVSQWQVLGLAMPLPTIHKAAFAYAANSMDYVVDGTIAGSHISAATIPTVATLQFGGAQGVSGSGQQYYRRVRYWPRALPKTELASVTR